MEESRFGYQKNLKAGEVLFKEGDTGDEMYLIKKGQIRITKRIGDEEKTLAILKEGDFFGEMAVLDQSPRSASAIAHTDCELIIVDREAFLRQVKENPFIEYVVETLTKRLRQTDEMLKFMYIQNEEKRLVSFVLTKAKSQGKETPDGIDTGVPANPDAISGMIGVDREKVTKVLNTLVNNGLILLKGNIIVRKIDLFERYLDYLDLKEKFER